MKKIIGYIILICLGLFIAIGFTYSVYDACGHNILYTVLLWLVVIGFTTLLLLAFKLIESE